MTCSVNVFDGQDGEAEKKVWTSRDFRHCEVLALLIGSLKQDKDEEEESELFVGDCVRCAVALS